VLDEYASTAPEPWTEVLRPALADKRGRALFIGTPHGYNIFTDLHQAASCRPDWQVFQFTTEEGGNVP
jgi:phage terminase large subunit